MAEFATGNEKDVPAGCRCFPAALLPFGSLGS